MRKIMVTAAATAITTLTFLPLAVTAPAATASVVAAARPTATAATEWDHIINYHNGKCLTMGAAKAGDLNAPVEQYTCDSTKQQNWTEMASGGYVLYKNESTEDCMSIDDNANGGKTAALIQYTCKGSADIYEQFSVLLLNDPGTYIASVGDYGTYVHPEGDSTANSAKMDVNAPAGGIGTPSYYWELRDS